MLGGGGFVALCMQTHLAAREGNGLLFALATSTSKAASARIPATLSSPALKLPLEFRKCPIQ